MIVLAEVVDSAIAIAAGVGAVVVIGFQFFIGPLLAKRRSSNNCTDKKSCHLHGERLAAVEAFVRECRDRLGRIEDKLDRLR